LKDLDRMKIPTLAAHAGVPSVVPDFLPTVLPIHASVTYRYESMNELDAVFEGTQPGFVYSRHGNPTIKALEDAVASLENAEASLAFSSGMAAIYATLICSCGGSSSPVVAARDIYGATRALLEKLLSDCGVATRFVDTTDLSAVEEACTQTEPAALLVETVSNPLLRVSDIQRLAQAAHRHGAILLVDSTFTTPVLNRPIELGADVVIHSATKYLSGHGDVLGGVVSSTGEWVTTLSETAKLTGATLGPQEAWLILRGLRTLPLRIQRQSKNAMKVAEWLEDRTRVGPVYYPGLPSHPHHGLAQRLFDDRGFGGMVSFELQNAGQDRVFRFLDALRVCIPVTTLGDVCTTLLYPAHSSHRSLTPRQRSNLGIADGLVRMSVGIEAVEDIINDLDQALNVLG
jgi:cystathionine beta-lyase/cystathionine gamma-synthase